jgi:hypothetical protein
MLGGSGRSPKYFAYQLYLRTAFSAKKSNLSQIFWVYGLQRKNMGNTNSRILSKFIFPHSASLDVLTINKKARTCELVKTPCTGVGIF